MTQINSPIPFSDRLALRKSARTQASMRYSELAASVLILKSVSFYALAARVRRQKRWMLARMSSASVDEAFDCVFEIGDRAEHASPEGAFGEQREEAFDLIDP
jgi:hypothetical protein